MIGEDDKVAVLYNHCSFLDETDSSCSALLTICCNYAPTITTEVSVCITGIPLSLLFIYVITDTLDKASLTVLSRLLESWRTGGFFSRS